MYVVFTMVNFFLKTISTGFNRAVQINGLQRCLTVTSKQFYHCSKENLEAENETRSVSYVRTDSDYGFGRRFVVKKIEELFKLKYFEAYDIASNNRELWKVTGKLMTKNYNLCKSNDVPDEVLLKCPTILAQKDLEEKLECLKDLWIPISECIPLVVLNIKTLKSLVENDPENFLHRLKHFSELFELPTTDICSLLITKTFLKNIDLDKAERNYKLILDYGIPKEELLRDVWALRYSTENIHSRLEQGKQSNIGRLKTWMIRANKAIYNGYIKRKNENKEILGESSVEEYLSERLRCSPEQIQVIINRHPALEHKSMPKLNEIIDYLLSKGFQHYHIVRAPKILLHSLETTKLRLEELAKIGIKVESLYILTKSQKQFLQYYESLKTNPQNR
ncbi:transcription termination factor, mitochondrial isoform X1 [Agrilus planipennis]|uniref:Transcription termination factor, mitochondrial isoform X1 n=1 Tax=Agrilus planipennis TaxID=224129 RepID=A0A1W4WDC3_AGRPL|nr:transcription termination factor, mitochondrial isoform X1 [Agrilus planipennis]